MSRLPSSPSNKVFCRRIRSWKDKRLYFQIWLSELQWENEHRLNWKASKGVKTLKRNQIKICTKRGIQAPRWLNIYDWNFANEKRYWKGPKFKAFLINSQNWSSLKIAWKIRAVNRSLNKLHKQHERFKLS